MSDTTHVTPNAPRSLGEASPLLRVVFDRDARIRKLEEGIRSLERILTQKDREIDRLRTERNK